MKNLSALRYQKLISDIKAIHLTAKQRVGALILQSRWEIGRRIVEEDQEGDVRAPYAEGLLERISEDLTMELGSGFSKTNLKFMRQFYLAYSIGPTSDQLDWSQYRELLKIDDLSQRAKLEKQAISNRWSVRDLRQEISRLKVAEAGTTQILLPAVALSECVLNVRRLMTLPVWGTSQKEWWLDLGFYNYAEVDLRHLKSRKNKMVVDVVEKSGQFHVLPSVTNKKNIFTFVAQIEEITDGDTLRLKFQLGLNNMTRQYIRLRGMNAPEMDTSEGQAAKRDLEKCLADVKTLIVHVTGRDRYGRFVADVFYLPRTNDPSKILARGIYLNQLLME